MKTARAKSILILTVAVVITFATVSHFLQVDAMPLTGKAVRVCRWQEWRGNEHWVRLQWLSDRELLAFGWVPGQTGSVRTMAYDVTNHGERALPSLASAVRTSGGTPWRISSNRAWLACWNINHALTEALSAVNLADGRLIRWASITPSRHYQLVGDGWMPDNQEYLALYDSEAIIFQTRGAQTIKRIRTPALASDSDLAGFLPDGRVLTVVFDPNRLVDRVRLTSFRLDTLHPDVESYTVWMPFTCKVKRALVSPDGKRLAWMLESGDGRPHLSLMRKLLRTFGIRLRRGTSVWISRLDGRNMTELGVESRNDVMLSNWHPSSQMISFTVGEDLYNLRVDH